MTSAFDSVRETAASPRPGACAFDVAFLLLAFVSCLACGDRGHKSEPRAAVPETADVRTTHRSPLVLAVQPLGEVDSVVIAYAVDGIRGVFDTVFIANVVG